mgnify:CR=1 FL=1
MQRRHFGLSSFILALTLASTTAAGGNDASAAREQERIERGRYLVTFGSCHDCHTPLKPGPKGPEPDMTRALSGHPGDLVMPPPPALNEAWIFAGSGTNTAWAGAIVDLTTDPDGAWSFLRNLRKHTDPLIADRERDHGAGLQAALRFALPAVEGAAQEVDQQRARLDLAGDGLAVDCHG